MVEQRRLWSVVLRAVIVVAMLSLAALPGASASPGRPRAGVTAGSGLAGWRVRLEDVPPEDVSEAREVGAWVSTVLGAAPDLWTGNSSFSYPLALPPGPGGFGPGLSLGYSSEAANSISLQNGGSYRVQAGLAGYGWTLSLPSIYSYGPDRVERTYVLVLNGKSYELKDGGNGHWHTLPESGLRILHPSHDPQQGEVYQSGSDVECGRMSSVPLATQYAQPWEVWAPDGSVYRFGNAQAGAAIGEGDATGYFRSAKGDCDPQDPGASPSGRWLQVANKWGLVEARDSHGNRYTVDWRVELVNATYQECGGTNVYTGVNPYNQYVGGMYPARISYADGQVQVVFGYAEREDHEHFHPPNTCNNQQQYVTQKLSSVAMWRNGHLVRQYDLVSGVPAGRRHLELERIELRGVEGAGPLPAAYSFSYELLDGANLNGVLLDTVANGYGGAVGFSYELRSIDQQNHNCDNGNGRWVVTRREAEDGRGQVTTTTYGYPAQGEAVKDCSDPAFEFLGFSPVTETLHPVGEPSGAAVRVVSSQFHQLEEGEPDGADLRKGRMYHQETGRGEVPLQVLDQAWTVDGDWVHLAGASSSLDGVTATTAYEYDGYGNVTQVREYQPVSGGGSSLYRTTTTEYVPLDTEGSYVADRPARQAVYEGAAGGPCASYTEYDHGTGYGNAPDAEGNLDRVRRAVDRCPTPTRWAVVRYEYDSYGNRTKEVVENGAVDPETRYGYDGSGIELESVTQENGTHDLVTTYGYDDYGRPDLVIQPNGLKVRTRYDPVGRVCGTERQPIGSVNSWYDQVRYAYSDTAGTALGCPDLDFPAGIVSNGLGVMEERSNDGAVAGYDPLAGDVSYDPHPGGLATLRFYDGLGRLVTAQSERNHDSQPWATSHQQYDALGQVATEWLPYGATLWTGGLPAAVGAVITHEYDALGRLLVTTLPDGSQTSLAYGANGNATKRLETATDARGNRTAGVFDVFGNLVRVREGPDLADEANDYAVTEYGYDVRGLLTSVTDAAGNVTGMDYDAAGRKTGMADPDMGTWYYKYDQAGNLTTQVDAKAQATCRYYDRLKRLEGKTYASGVADPAGYVCPASAASYEVSFSYDSCLRGAGQRCSADNETVNIAYEYDIFGRLSAETYSDLPGVAESYRLGYTYDNLDRRNGVQYPDLDLAITTFDAGGHPYSLSGGGESLVRQSSYRPWGALNRRKLGHDLWLDNDYDETTNRRWLTARWLGQEDGSGRLLDLSYGHDPVGNVVAAGDGVTGESATYAYDHRDRLVDWWLDGGLQQHLTYDEIGNLTNLGGVSYSYPASGSGSVHPHAVTGTDAGGSFTYDANGNMTGRQMDGRTYEQSWDQENRLASVTTGGLTLEFAYDADGRRVLEGIADSYRRVYLGDLYDLYWDFNPLAVTLERFTAAWEGERVLLGWETVSEIDNQGFNLYRSVRPDGRRVRVNRELIPAQVPGGTSGASYEWYDGSLPVGSAAYYWLEAVALDGSSRLYGPASVGVVDLDGCCLSGDRGPETETAVPTKYYFMGGERVASKQYAQIYYFHGDHLGSNRLATYGNGPQAGNVVSGSRTSYEPYGDLRAGWPNMLYGFTGQRLAPLPKVYYYGARYYDPALARFISADTVVPEPANPQSLNRYSYGLNNPVRYTDPTGHAPCLDCIGGGGGTGWPFAAALAAYHLAVDLGITLQEAAAMIEQAPAIADRLLQAAEGTSSAGNTSPVDPGGTPADPGGLDPNDPIFRKLIQQTGEADPIKAIAKASVEGPAREGARNGMTVLGRYPTYVNAASELRANYLNFAEGTWEKLTDAQRWAVNKQFLDDAIARSDVIRLASSLKEAEAGTFFRRELEYLFSLGYEIVGDILVKSQ
jgi:RHS repeat-associated protein